MFNQFTSTLTLGSDTSASNQFNSTCTVVTGDDGTQQVAPATTPPVKATTIIDNGQRVLVDIRKIKVDPTYQRVETSGSKKIQIMAKTFNRLAFGDLIINIRPNGEIVAVDGMGRLIVLGMIYGTGTDNGKPVMVWCRNVNVKTVEEEAALYDLLNTGRKNTTNQSFKARHRAGEHIENTIVEILDKAGIHIQYHTGKVALNCTTAPCKFREVFDVLTEPGFRNLVSVIASYQRPEDNGVIERDALRSDFIHGMTIFMKEFSGNVKTAIRAFSNGYSAADIYSLADQKSQSSGWKRKAVMYEVIKRSYKKGLKALSR